jgi:hypothetical protein
MWTAGLVGSVGFGIGTAGSMKVSRNCLMCSLFRGPR